VAFICLFPRAASAAETLRLEFTVSNPSKESKEIDVYVDLPADLRKEDIQDAGGLDVRYISEKNTYAVTGKVVLQGGETTLYQIAVNDVWSFQKTELDSYRQATERLPDVSRARAKILLSKIETGQKTTRGDIPSHIARYRENRVAIDKLERELGPIPSDKMPLAPLSASAAILAVAGLAFAYLKRPRRDVAAVSGENTEERRKMPRVIIPKDVECRLLVQPDDTPPAEEISVAPRDLSEGGVCLELGETYRAQSVLEIRMKLPSFEEPLLFRGSVVWQKKVLGADNEHRYMTGIQLGEATYEDFQKLKDYVNDRTH
jgi:hypothetical protein